MHLPPLRTSSFGLLVWASATLVLVTGCGRKPVKAAALTSATIGAALPAEPRACTADDRPLPNDGLREPAGLGGCPPGMAPIATAPGRCIDRWEAFLVEVSGDGQERAFSPYAHPRGHTVRAKSAPGAIPQAYIDAKQAAGACEVAGKRLCTDAEWVAACRGEGARAFPYGTEERLGVCNDHRARNPALDDLRADAGDEHDKLTHPCVNQLPDTLTRTGSKEACVTPERVFDLVGNVHEWTSHEGGAFRGGFFGDTQQNGRGCAYVTTAHDQTYWDYSTGFRCCSDQP